MHFSYFKRNSLLFSTRDQVSSAFVEIKFGNAGQAAAEYILILVVTVTILLMLTAQIFKPFQSFIKAYMGDYVQCLLETGELPSLGGESGIQDDGCNARFESATWNGGRPPRSSERTAQQSSSKSASGRGTDSSGNSKESSTYAGSASRSNPFFRGGRNNSLGMDGVRGPGKIVEISYGGKPNEYFRVRTESAGRTTRQKAIGISGYTEEQLKKLAQKGSRSQSIISTEVRGPAAKKITLKPPPAKTGIDSSEEASWSIGTFLRIIFIAAIIIILIALMGGQVARLMKSWEK